MFKASGPATLVALLCLIAGLPASGGVNAWTPLGPYGGGVNGMAVDPFASGTLWLATDGGVFKTTDSGGHWARVFAPVAGIVRSVVAHPTTPGTVLACTYQGVIWKTTDAGASWSVSSGGIPTPIGASSSQIEFKRGDPSVVYARFNSSLYQSTDGGSNWLQIGAADLAGKQLFELFIDPATPTTLWVRAAALGIMKSVNGGANWSPSNTNLPSTGSGVPLAAFAADPLAPATMYVLTSSGPDVWKSINGGATWALVTTAIPYFSQGLLVTPGQSNVLFFGGQDPATFSYHVYKSPDGGATWSNATGTLWTGQPAPLAIPAASPSTVYAAFGEGFYVTNDAGATWQPINAGLRAWEINNGNPAFDPTTPSTWYFHGSEHGIYKTIDGGATFSPINGNLTDPANGAMVVDPNNHLIIYAAGQTAAGAGAGFFNYFSLFVKSTDGGTTWSQVLNPAVDGTSLQAWGFALLPTVPTTAYVAGPIDGVFKSTDGGVTFNPVNTGLPNSSFPFWGPIVATDAVGTNVVVGAFSHPPDDPYRTTSGGASWSITSGMPGGTVTETLVTDPSNPLTVYAGTTNGVFQSSDGGATWVSASGGLPSGNVFAMTIDPSSTTTLYASDHVAGAVPFPVYRSTDGGGSWSLLNNNNGNDLAVVDSLAVDPANHLHVLALGRGGLSEMTLDPTDPLGKGVSATVEAGVPNLSGSGTGDGNGDGIPDTTEPNVASLPTNTGGGWVTVAAPDGSGQALFGVTAIPNPSPGDTPPGASFPYGLVKFNLNGLAPGGCTTVTLYFNPPNRAITAYYKYGPTIDNTAPHWYDFTYDGTTGAEIFQDPTRTRIVLHLCDGMRGDSDLIANGVISEPGGPAAVQGPTIPTLSLAGLTVLAVLVAALGAVILRRRVG
ncbi:MAG: IPTL-CTERM sorting domain-containing protein [Thermoanaerobaculales bacterium]